MNVPVRRPELSVIIPVIDESPHLARLLRQLREQRDISLEIVVADGGSADDSVRIAALAGAKVIEARLGRAKQMNAGRRVATADTLLFLHADSDIADSDLLRHALDAYTRAVASTPVPVAGHFALEFVTEGPKTFGYRYLEQKTRLNRKNTTNGDQGFLVRADYFDAIGPFDERMTFLEDQRFAESFRKVGEWLTLPGTLRTSARRFEKEGFGRRYLVMSITMGMFDAGLDLFFDLAPTIYPTQKRTGRLDPLPYLGAVVKMMRALGPWKSIKGWYKVGSFVRENSWQLFYVLDVAFDRDPEKGFTKFHDLVVEPFIDHPIGNAITAVGLFYFSMGLCPVWFTISPVFERNHDAVFA